MSAHAHDSTNGPPAVECYRSLTRAGQPACRWLDPRATEGVARNKTEGGARAMVEPTPAPLAGRREGDDHHAAWDLVEDYGRS